MASLSPSQDAEILVHVTAPSRVADDAVYRQLAQAYLAFQPRSRSELPLEDATCRPGQRLASAPSSSQGFAVPSSEQLLVINSQNLSFRSALDNLSSPRLQFAPLAQNHVVPSSQETGVGSQTLWCAPPSQISDSYPMPDAGMLHISPTRVLQRYLGRPSLQRPSPESSSRSPPSSPSPRKRPPPPLRDQGRIYVPSSLPEPETEQQSPPLPLRAPLYVKVNQTIPVTPQVPETNGPGPEALDDSSELFAESAFDITHISSSVVSNPSPAPSHRAGSEPPPAKRPKVGHLQHGDLVRSSSDTGPAILSSNTATEELSYSLEIRPPSPPVGVTDVDPSDLISEKLAKLARDLSSRYRPDSKREIDPFERGYWLLDCKGWSPEVRFGAWVFLNNYLRSGLAGWGTWCRRDNRHSWIRLYCWGHVAKHTYLLLYLASGRHLKHTGAVWYGADGEPVLDVPPYDKQS